MTEQRDRWWLVVAAGLCVFMAILDMSAVNVAPTRPKRRPPNWTLSARKPSWRGR